MRLRGRFVGTLLVVPLLVLGCGRPEAAEQPLPAGVSVDPPARVPETGGLSVPGQEVEAPAPIAEEPPLTDTVTPPVERPEETAAPQ